MIRSISCATAASALVLGLSLVGVSAQQREFVEAQQANKAALRQYTWKSRTELTLAGESKNVTLEQVRYDLDGRLQKTVVGGGQSERDETRPGRLGPGGAIRKRVIARKREEFKDLMSELAALVSAYAHLPPDRLQAFAARAAISKGQGVETGSVRIHGRGVLATGDQMTIWIDPATFVMRRVDITTALEDKPVSLVADYRTLDNGLTYQARAVLRYPDRQLELTTETFDYVLANTSR